MFKQFSILKLVYEMLKHCACLSLFLCILRVGGQTGCDVVYCRATRIVQFNDLLVASDVRWNRTLSRFDCFRLCYDDRKCVSFQHNSVSDQCRGYNTSFTGSGLVQTSPEVETRLYSMCNATQRLQSECGNDEDCKRMEKVCVEGACQSPSLNATSPENYTRYSLGEYLGCYLDSREDHMWNHTFRDMTWMTNTLCIDFCVRSNYKLAGTFVSIQYAGYCVGLKRYYYDCFCGDVIKSWNLRALEDDCWTGCYGNATQMCGGDGYLSVYATGL